MKGEIGPEKELVVTFNMGHLVICLAANGVIRIKFSDTRVEQNMGSVLNDHTWKSLASLTPIAKYQNQANAASTNLDLEMSRYLWEFYVRSYAETCPTCKNSYWLIEAGKKELSGNSH